MTQVLLIVAGAILFVLGTLHGILALRDIRKPEAFTPLDASVRAAMKDARLAFAPRVNIWDAWLGFNISHSIGVMLFGGVLLFTGWSHAQAFADSVAFQAVSLAVAAAYFATSLRFWFWGPSLGSGLATVCIVGAIVS